MSIDQIIALAACIGTLLAAGATFLTVREMARQRETSYHPELVFSTVRIDTAAPKEGEHNVQSLMRWQHAGSSSDRSSFAIPLVNIGLGAATKVSIQWSFPMETFVGEIARAAIASNNRVPIFFENGLVTLDQEKMTSVWRNQQTAEFDFVLPVSVDGSHRMVTIPHGYIMAVAAAIHIMGNSHPLREIAVPPLVADLNFADISETHHTRSFDLAIEIGAFTSISMFAQLNSLRKNP